ncbi:hypothetical protein AMJ80_01265 [bacterium SM23_31]|nr:MAG: hypothetical protein AMJ80_01265 [bacterium SM23_31]
MDSILEKLIYNYVYHCFIFILIAYNLDFEKKTDFIFNIYLILTGKNLSFINPNVQKDLYVKLTV